ncbi:MAG: hypothetical protein L6R42_008110 [Xanthoria sp. 1 TBL-2021]|nr:MAG: hypothetical protein L6R42_008110 [Xanthoria sp. 1 TBL-2021]
MKTSVFALGFALAQVYANIPVKPHAMRCGDGVATCLSEAIPCDRNKCLVGKRSLGDLYPPSFRRSDIAIPNELQARAPYSTDGTCGKQAGGTICDPNATGYKGTCCSGYGYCGNTDVYCGTGCQSGCTTPAPPANPGTAPRPDGRCGLAEFNQATCDPNGPFGGCCSSYGYCGKTDGHCGVGCLNGCNGGGGGTTPTNPPTSSSSQEPIPGEPTNPPTSSSSQEPILGEPTNAPVTGGTQTPNGNCGLQDDGKTVYICGNWPQGGCCSAYGFCGKTAAHCGAGCQSGPCVAAPVAPAPGPSPAPVAANPGSLRILPAGSPGVQAGVPAMHAGLMPNGRVVFLDKVEDSTQLKLPNGQFAYSAEYDPATNKVLPLSYKTNAFCSGGAFLADGRFVSIGGNAPLDFIDPTVGDGFNGIRYLSRSATDAALTGQSWSEPGNKIASPRWYASVQTMPDGTLFVASGSLNGLDPTVKTNNNPTYEILNAQGISSGRNIPLEILNKNQPYYMYPFIHLLNNGQLFIAVAKSAEIFDVATNAVTKALPDIPGTYRTYPNTGGSVLLPLSSANGYAPDVMICGGGAYQDITSPTEASCARMKPLDANPQWEMDSMPQGRGMVEGTLLPDGTVIWANGCNLGAQGFGVAKAPTLDVLIYDPVKPKGQRWSTGPTSIIPRLYHSVTLLLLDGTLMIAGSNPVEQPKLTPVPNKVPSEDFVTEYRIEIYTPPYLSGANANKRPTGMTLSSKSLKADGSTFTVQFTAPAGNKAVKVALYHGGFVTHSLHMNHRMIFLDTTGYQAGATAQTITAKMPPNRNVAQPGPYVVYVTVDGVPAVGQFVSVA